MERAVDDHAGVVADDVNTTEVPPCALGQGQNLSAVTDVGRDTERPSTAPLDRLDDGGHPRFVDVGDDDRGALAGERLDEGLTDSAAAPGDDGDAPTERLDDDTSERAGDGPSI
jgi:hypothetical protein